MKKISVFALVCVMCMFMAVCAFAAMPRLVDDANLLRAAEADIVADKLDSVSEEYGFDIVIVTVETVGNSAVRTYAENFYDNNGYAADGILLLLCMDSRDYWFCTTGEGMRVFSDSRLIAIEDKILGDLGSGRYYNAFCKFADMCGNCLEKGADASYTSTDEDEPFDVTSSVIISLVIGFVIALIVVSVWKGQLKSVKFQPDASAYIKQGSLKITQSSDTFLYHTVSRTPKASSSSSSSGGGSHGGRGGKF